MKRKIVTMILAFAMLLAFVGCGEGNNLLSAEELEAQMPAGSMGLVIAAEEGSGADADYVTGDEVQDMIDDAVSGLEDTIAGLEDTIADLQDSIAQQGGESEEGGCGSSIGVSLAGVGAALVAAAAAIVAVKKRSKN